MGAEEKTGIKREPVTEETCEERGKERRQILEVEYWNELEFDKVDLPGLV